MCASLTPHPTPPWPNPPQLGLPQQQHPNMGVAPMDLGAIRLQRLNEQECQHLRAQGACFKCRQRRHRANECLTYQNPQPQANPWQNLPPRPGRQLLNNLEAAEQLGNGNRQ